MEWRNIKVRVNNPEMSKAFQEEAFKNGCEWISGLRSVQHINAKFIYINSVGGMECDSNESRFYVHKNIEVIVSTTTTYKFSLNEDDTIEFNGRTYNKVKFLNAIKGLEQ